MRSETSKIIDRIISAGPKHLLAKAGYKKMARSFYLESEGLFRILNFQSSQWNNPSSARFTVNLDVTVPVFHEKYCDKPFPKNPASGAPVIQQRIGAVMPHHRDHWWEVDSDSDVEMISREVVEAISEPWTAIFRSIQEQGAASGSDGSG